MRLALGPLFNWGPTTNSFVTPSVAAYSWDFLGYLLVFTGVSLLAALIPLFQHIPLDDTGMSGMSYMTGMEYMTGMQYMTGMEDMTGIKYITGVNDMTDPSGMTGMPYVTGTQGTGYRRHVKDTVRNYVERRNGFRSNW